MPDAIAFQAQYAEHGDKFAILTIHDKSVKSLAELDRKLPPLSVKYWGGKPLPFPILLDGDGTTEERFAVEAHPTSLLIDPDGKLVGEAQLGDLAKKLPPVSAAKAWAAQRDRFSGYTYGYSRDENGRCDGFAQSLKRATHCEVELDAAAIRDAGFDPKGDLPGFGAGRAYSWRSAVELCLEPHGLGVTPSADGTKLIVTKCPPVGGPPSPLQAVANTELAERLGRPAKDRERAAGKALAIDNLTLAEAVKRIHAEYDVPFALDPKAVVTKRLDPLAGVTAKLGPGDLGDGLAAMLTPLGLRYEVRCEVIWVTAK